MTQDNFAEETKTITEVTKIDMVIEKPGAIAKIETPETTAGQFQDIKDQVLTILSELPAYISNFFAEYQKPIVTVGLILTGAVSVKVTLAVLNALNEVPLVAPTFELIGIGYAGWFVYRYLLKASDRQELLAEIESLKEQVVGKDS
ncbi:MAG: CAAD domain-containing protein [Microcoleus anatoxicus]|uniref:CAAD domain-containing protein n=1 Tax=Microcoleus anatoxicus TaxID=2705319 RepID=UPI00366E6719